MKCTPAAVAALLLASTLVRAQNPSPPPVFQSGVDVVLLDVSVLDARRRPVADLAESDFTVLEDGRPRPIRGFRVVDLPGRAVNTATTWTTDVAPDVATNAVGHQDGRLAIILMDRSIPVGGPTVTARKAATAIVSAMGPNDLGAVISTSGGMPQTLTGDKARLITSIEQRDWSMRISEEAEAIIGKQDPMTDGGCTCGLCVMQSVTRVAEAVRDTPQRRKLLFFIGSRLVVQAGPRAPSADVGCTAHVKAAREAMFDALKLANLTVHSIDPSGLATVGPQARASARGGIGSGAAAARLQAFRDETAEVLSDRGSLGVLPGLTGGTVVGGNAPDLKVADLFDESRTYYVLGFEPSTPARAGTRRAIQVRVARKNVTVHTQGQVQSPLLNAAPRDAAAPPRSPLDQALTALLPSAQTPLEAAVAAFAAREGGGADVRIDLDVSAFAASTGVTDLTVAVMAVDQTGRPIRSVQQSADVPSSTTAPVTRDRSVPVRLDLAPGAYEIRSAVEDPASGRVGSVFAQLDVPRFDRAPLSLSTASVIVGGRVATRRRFSRGDEVLAEIEIYQGTLRDDALRPVSVRVRIIDAKGAEVRNQMAAFDATRFVDRRATGRLALPVAQLPPGDYLMRIDAAMDRETASRSLRFSVD